MVLKHIGFSRSISTCLESGWFSGNLYAHVLESLELVTCMNRSRNPLPSLTCPCLKDLTLQQFLLPMSSPAYRGLRKLNLSFWKRSKAKLHFLSIVAACPHLEDLMLSMKRFSDVFEDGGDPRQPMGAPMKLPRMAPLYLHLPHRDLHYVLSSIALIASAKIHLVVHDVVEIRSSFSFPILLPLDPLCISSLKNTCQLRIDREDQPVTASLIRYPLGDGSIPVIESKSFFQISEVSEHIYNGDSLASLLRHFSSIHSIILYGVRVFSSFASLLPEIRTVHLINTGGDQLRVAVKLTLVSCCPKLQHLEISRSNLTFESHCRSRERRSALSGSLQATPVRQAGDVCGPIEGGDYNYG